MLSKGPAKKVTIYVNEDSRHHMGPLYEAILTFLLHHGVSGATATRAMAGFGAHHVMHTPKVEALSEHLPVRIEFIETAEKVEELLPTLYDMVTDGLVEVHDTTVVKMASKDKQAEPKRPHIKQQGEARLMRVFIGEADKWHGEPLYEAIVKQLRMLEIDGATVYRGILGYGAKRHTHKQSFWHPVKDLPVMIAAVDTPGKLAKAIEALEEMIDDGLIVTSEVEVVRLLRGRDPEEASNAGSEAS